MVISPGSGSVSAVPHLKTVPLCLRFVSFKVAGDTSEFFDSSRTTKSPSVPASCSTLAEVYTLGLTLIGFSSLGANDHVRNELAVVQVMFKLLLTQTAKDPLAGSSVTANVGNDTS